MDIVSPSKRHVCALPENVVSGESWRVVSILDPPFTLMSYGQDGAGASLP